jgi:hypothetical protein
VRLFHSYNWFKFINRGVPKVSNKWKQLITVRIVAVLMKGVGSCSSMG